METNSEDTTLNLNISGMTCANCALKISTKLRSLPGIQQADVILPTESAKVVFDKNKINIDEILESIDQIGYHATPSKISVELLDQKTSNQIETIKGEIRKLSGILNVTFQEDKHLLKIIFNSGELSENHIMKEIKSLGLNIKKTTGILDQEKENFQNELRYKKHLLLLSLILSTPTVILNEILMLSTIFDGIMQPIHYILFVLATIIQIFVGSYFYKSAYKTLRARSSNMDVLISIGSATAYLYSVYNTFFSMGHVFYGDSVLIFTFILLGKYLETIAKGKTSSAITKLMELGANTARVLRNNVEQMVDIDDVDINEIIVVKPGEKIPLDGKIIEGTSRIDEAMITGEPIPAKKQIGDIVIGGTINQNGLLRINVDKVGSDTMLSRIIELVKNAQTQKAPLQRLADRVSTIFVPVVVSIAFIAFAYWYWVASFTFEDALVRFVTVVVISCPCALGLAIPTAIMVGTGQGANAGILIKGGESLEAIHKVNNIVFDKTGTLTIGKPQLTDIIPLGITDEKELLKFSATMESGSEHPLGLAIINYAKEQNISLGHPTQFNNLPGYGIEGIIENHKILVGNMALAQKQNVDLKMASSTIAQLQDQGKTIVLVIKDAILIGVIAVADTIKEYTKETIDGLKKLGIKTYMITGDHQRTAEAIAKIVGIDNYYAEVLPAQKLERIAEIQKN
jgi:Cu+-exporting ATPase